MVCEYKWEKGWIGESMARKGWFASTNGKKGGLASPWLEKDELRVPDYTENTIYGSLGNAIYGYVVHPS
ncbi:hypothetical protein GN958_ATG10954 [Phytophthora infestans]|uniref:Uncharacterized protein n=1 Tax=Phytophthora infestans TaxID=4787 RepID=A0A8S9UH82_PHYIN|nr:hypothetical protein GN958_ATG10954 [Phytophthora infestans]